MGPGQAIGGVRRAVLLALATLLMWGCNDTPPKGWREYSAEQLLTFVGPPDLMRKPVHGIDSYVAEWHGERLVVSLVAGAFGGGFAIAVPAKKITVDGRPALLYVDERGTSPLSSFGRPQVGFKGGGVSVLVGCESAADIPDALRLVKSIRFARRERRD